MKAMTISEFKAKALKVVGDVAATQESVIVVKRGKPIAEVIPYRRATHKPVPGRLAHTLLFEKDIVSPLGEGMWEAGR